MPPINPLDFANVPSVILLVAYLGLSVWAFVKGWVVPRFIYDRAVLRGDKAVDAIEGLTESVQELTKEVRFKGGHDA
jgi:hypothetical protein